METSKKVYDFSFDQVRDQVARSLRQNGNRGTVADVVGASGLPKHQVETVLPAVVAECRGQMAVTESGEILYKFPQGLTNPERSWGQRFVRGLAKVLRALFKAWIVVMLVGYFVLFVAILVVALLVSIALSFARRDDDRSDGVGGFMAGMVVGRVFEFFWMLWLFSGDPVERQHKRTKPFHKAVFDYVFGVEEKPEVQAKRERKAAISLIRQKKGTITLEDLMALTGKPRVDADAFVSRLLLEFEGEPRVTDQGTLTFWFPELLRTSQDPKPYVLPETPLIPADRNPPSTNGWIVGFNLFNLVLALYFTWFGIQGVDHVAASRDNLGLVYLITMAISQLIFHAGQAATQVGVLVTLGFVPLVYSGLFFGIRAVRRARERVKNFAIQANNLRRKVVAAVLRGPDQVKLTEVLADPAAQPMMEGMLRDVAAQRSVDVVSAEGPVFQVADLAREQADVEAVRKATDLSQLKLGKVVFDTEDEL